MEKLPFICIVTVLCYLTILTQPVDSQLFESYNITSPFDIYDFINSRKSLIGVLINLDPDTHMSQLYPQVAAADDAQVRMCYNASVTTDNEEYDIFKYTIFEVIKAYYKYFPENFEAERFCEKVKALFKSVNEIACHTVRCLGKPSNYQLGLTQVSDFTDAEYRGLLGERGDPLETAFAYNNRPVVRERPTTTTEAPVKKEKKMDVYNYSYNAIVPYPVPYQNPYPQPYQQPYPVQQPQPYQAPNPYPAPSPYPVQAPNPYPNQSPNPYPVQQPYQQPQPVLHRYKRQNQVSIDPMCFPKNKTSMPQKFDWRRMGRVTPAKWQGSCGSCWAFASIATMESAHLIKGKTRNKNFDLSEDQLVGCAKKDGCNGGTAVDAFNFFLTNKGVTDEKTLPYNYKDIKCRTKNRKRVAKIKDYCLRGVYVNVNGKPEKLTDDDIMGAIREFGPVYSTLDADDLAVKHHKSGIYTNPKCPKATNHAVTIVGWTKRAWVVKNSWGPKWGDQGFFKMKKGENLCGINTYITYPIL